mgnify:CR=1 FL=1
MKLYRLTAVLSLLYLIGVAGNNDAGLEPDLARMCTKLLIGTAVFALSSWKGGLFE